MGGLWCPLCGEGLRPTGLRCPTCTADVGWWLIASEEARGPLELRELREALDEGVFDGLDWITLGAEGLRQKPEAVAEVLRGSDYPKFRLIEDWVDFRNLFRLALITIVPALVLALLLLYWILRVPAQ